MLTNNSTDSLRLGCQRQITIELGRKPYTGNATFTQLIGEPTSKGDWIERTDQGREIQLVPYIPGLAQRVECLRLCRRLIEFCIEEFEENVA